MDFIVWGPEGRDKDLGVLLTPLLIKGLLEIYNGILRRNGKQFRFHHYFHCLLVLSLWLYLRACNT